MRPLKIIITGGAQGIGKATAEYLSNTGYKIIVLDNDQEAIEEFNQKHSGIETIPGDVSDEKDVIRAIKLAGPDLYGIINNAAIGINKSVIDLSLAEWNKVIGINLTGCFLTAKYAFKQLKENCGAIINIASTRALMSERDTEAYSASKGGLVALTHALAVSFGPHVRVNAISPGWIETRHLKKESKKQQVEHSAADKIQHPVGRVGETADIVSLIEYLLSEKASFITGQNFVVDGGMTKKMIYTE